MNFSIANIAINSMVFLIITPCLKSEHAAGRFDCVNYTELYDVLESADRLMIANAESYSEGKYHLQIVDPIFGPQSDTISLLGLSPDTYDDIPEQMGIIFDYAHESWNSLLGTQAFGFVCPLAPFSPPPYAERVRGCHLFLEIGAQYLIGLDQGLPILSIPTRANENLIRCAKHFEHE